MCSLGIFPLHAAFRDIAVNGAARCGATATRRRLMQSYPAGQGKWVLRAAEA